MRDLVHKKTQFLKQEVSNKDGINIIFLDIDGVIQPTRHTNRFLYDLDKLPNYIATKMKDEYYLNMDKYDLGACYYDWDEIAIGILKKALNETNSYLVIHSGWKDVLTKEDILALFRLHNLDEYIIDILDKGDKIRVINEYLEKNKNIKDYLILDDCHFELHFGDHFHLVKDCLVMQDYCYIVNYFSSKGVIIETNVLYLHENGSRVYCECKKLGDSENFKIIDISNLDTYLLHRSEIFINNIISNAYKNEVPIVVFIDTKKNKEHILNNYIKRQYETYQYQVYYMDTLNKGFKFREYIEKYDEEISTIINSSNLSTI